jgi:hypothetical protein
MVPNLPELQQEIFKEHLQIGKLRVDLHNRPTVTVAVAYTHKKYCFYNFIFLQFKIF